MQKKIAVFFAIQNSKAHCFMNLSNPSFSKNSPMFLFISLLIRNRPILAYSFSVVISSSHTSFTPISPLSKARRSIFDFATSATNMYFNTSQDYGFTSEEKCWNWIRNMQQQVGIYNCEPGQGGSNHPLLL